MLVTIIFQYCSAMQAISFSCTVDRAIDLQTILISIIISLTLNVTVITQGKFKL